MTVVPDPYCIASVHSRSTSSCLGYPLSGGRAAFTPLYSPARAGNLPEKSTQLRTLDFELKNSPVFQSLWANTNWALGPEMN